MKLVKLGRAAKKKKIHLKWQIEPILIMMMLTMLVLAIMLCIQVMLLPLQNVFIIV